MEADMSALEDHMRQQRTFVRAVKKKLEDSIAADLLLDREWWKATSLIEQQEQDGRMANINLAEMEEFEAMMRFGIITFEESVEFKRILKKRSVESLVPWCNNQCAYCCMARLEWTKHISAVYASMRHVVEKAHKLAFRALLREEEAEFRAITQATGITVEIQTAHELQQSLLIATEEKARRETSAEEKESFIAFILEKERVEKQWASQRESIALRDKHLAVMRIQDSLGLQERRVLRQTSLLLCEEERTKREHMASAFETRLEALNNQAVAALNTLMGQRWKREMEDMINDRNDLAQFKAATIAQLEREKEEKKAAAQLELEAEFKELKKLKKQGPPKVVPIPPCARCGQVPQKDAFTHRTAECPERPTQCAKCELIMPMSSMEEHKDVCPSRVVQCPNCGNHYKASYLEGPHTKSNICQQVAQSREIISGLVPMLPIERPTEFVPDVGAAFCFVADNTKTIFVATSVAGIPVNCMEDVEEALTKSALKVGAACPITIISPEEFPEELVGSLRDLVQAPSSENENTMRIRLHPEGTMSFDDYAAFASIVEKDEAQYCKPQPMPAAKKKGK